jgi:hypothetical protein
MTKITVHSTTRPAQRRRRPDFGREVTAPSITATLLTFLVFLGATVAAMTHPWRIDGGDVFIFAIFISASISGIVGFGVFAMQLANYRQQQWEYEQQREETEPQQRQAREIERVGARRDVVRRCTWGLNWKRGLARKLHDSQGNWTGGDAPTRDLFTDLVTSYADQYNRRNIQADLHDLGWLDDDDNWTDKARADLRVALFMEF